MIWTIEPHLMAYAKTPGPEVYFQREFGAMVNIAIFSFVLRSGEETLLVDTGLVADPGPLNTAMRERKGAEAGFRPVARLPEILDRPPAAVMLTSFGPYAVGGLCELGADVPLVVSARGVADLAEPEEPALHHALAEPLAERLRGARAVVGAGEVRPGVAFVEVGVHHPHSAAVLVHTAEGCVAIVDPVFCRRNLEEGMALGVAEDVPGWYALVRRLAGSCDALIPIHDPDPTPVPVSRWHSSLTGRAPC